MIVPDSDAHTFHDHAIGARLEIRGRLSLPFGSAQ